MLPIQAMRKQKYASVYDLARLPYFEMDGERLRIADPSLGPVVDVHTHLALGWILPMRVDLTREHPQTRHFLPQERELDLDVYANRNFSEADLAALRKALSAGAIRGGSDETHTVPNLAREMSELSIASSVLLPIDLPFGLSGNTAAYLEAATGRADMLCFGSVHPYDWGVERKLDQQVAQGVRGIKLHPTAQFIRPDDARCLRLYRLCAARDLPILWHCGPVGIEHGLGRRLSQVSYFDKAISESPDAVFILGHSGALQMEVALELAEAFPNVWLEISSQAISNVQVILERADPRRVLFGSDWPFYHQAIPLAKVLLVTEGAEDRRRAVLYDNAARLFGLPPRGET